jgi:hypothetical protein
MSDTLTPGSYNIFSVLSEDGDAENDYDREAEEACDGIQTVADKVVGTPGALNRRKTPASNMSVAPKMAQNSSKRGVSRNRSNTDLGDLQVPSDSSSVHNTRDLNGSDHAFHAASIGSQHVMTIVQNSSRLSASVQPCQVPPTLQQTRAIVPATSPSTLPTNGPSIGVQNPSGEMADDGDAEDDEDLFSIALLRLQRQKQRTNRTHKTRRIRSSIPRKKPK